MTRALRPVLARWETFLVLLIILEILLFSIPGSPLYTAYFFNSDSLLTTASSYVIAVGLMALPLTLIVITGNIDLSVESTLGMTAIVFAVSWSNGTSIWVAVLFALAVGAVGGLFNGLIVAYIRLPSLVVTLGTYALFRGIAYLVKGDASVPLLGTPSAPQSFINLGSGTVGSTPIPQYLVVFAVLAVIFTLVLHRTSFGRYLYAIGNNEEACRYSGVRVAVIITILFIVSGVMAALAGLIEGARETGIKADIGSGYVLGAVTAVVLGGVDIFGGSGTMIGPILALIVLGLLQDGLGLQQVSPSIVSLVIGCLLILSILIPNVIRYSPHLIGQIRSGLARRTQPRTLQ